MSSRRFIAIAAGAAALCGATASGAGAYAVSGGAFTGTNTSPITFAFGGGAASVSCPSATYSGTASGAASFPLTPAFSGCNFAGFPVSITQSGSWRVTVVAGPDGSGNYTGALSIPSGTITTYAIPLAGCTVTVAGPLSFPNTTSLINWAGSAEATIHVVGISYTSSLGCPFASGTDGTYSGAITLPGVTIS